MYKEEVCFTKLSGKYPLREPYIHMETALSVSGTDASIIAVQLQNLRNEIDSSVQQKQKKM